MNKLNHKIFSFSPITKMHFAVFGTGAFAVFLGICALANVKKGPPQLDFKQGTQSKTALSPKPEQTKPKVEEIRERKVSYVREATIRFVQPKSENSRSVVNKNNAAAENEKNKKKDVKTEAAFDYSKYEKDIKDDPTKNLDNTTAKKNEAKTQAKSDQKGHGTNPNGTRTDRPSQVEESALQDRPNGRGANMRESREGY